MNDILLLLTLDERLVRLNLGAKTRLYFPGGGHFTHLLHQTILHVEKTRFQLAHRAGAQ